MMLPNNHPSAPPVLTMIPTPPPAIAEPADSDDGEPSHADYNLHPLAVRSLEHYAEHEDDERFHIR